MEFVVRASDVKQTQQREMPSCLSFLETFLSPVPLCGVPGSGQLQSPITPVGKSDDVSKISAQRVTEGKQAMDTYTSKGPETEWLYFDRKPKELAFVWVQQIPDVEGTLIHFQEMRQKSPLKQMLILVLSQFRSPAPPFFKVYIKLNITFIITFIIVKINANLVQY